jgi:translation initiation factor 2B subunit (eIF-2B alpha/beta/delta family)
MLKSVHIGVAAASVILIGAGHFPALGQTPSTPNSPAISNPPGPDASKVESFRSRLQEQQKTLESYGAKISGLVDRLKAMSGATVESRVAEVRSLRDAMVQLGSQLEPGAPLSQSIDQYQSWISAQIGRINNQRSTLGAEFVQELLRRYQQYQQEVTRARESVSNHSNAIDRALKELTTAEIRAAEMLMAEDAAAAVKELLGVLDSVGQTVDEIRSNLRKLGNAGV